MLTLATEEVGDIVCLEVTGRLDAVTSSQFNDTLLPLLNESKKVLVRCGSMEYISSAGLRVLLVAHKTGGKLLALSELTEMVREVLEVSGFDELFQIAPDKENGLRILG